MAYPDELDDLSGAPYGADDVTQGVAEQDGQVTEEGDELIDVGNLANDPNFRRFQSAYDQKLARLQQELEQAKQQAALPEAPQIAPPSTAELIAAETARDRYFDLYERYQEAVEDDPQGAKAQSLWNRLERAGALLRQADTAVYARQVGLDPDDAGLRQHLEANAAKISNGDQLEAAIARYAATQTTQARQRIAQEQKKLQQQQAQAQKQVQAVQRQEQGANALPGVTPKGNNSALAAARREYQGLAGKVGMQPAMRRMQLLREYPELAS